MRAVIKTETCWLWQGTVNTWGYGKLSILPRGTTIKVHRLSYIHHKGPIPNELVIDHLCRIPNCVNPDHLEAVTAEENRRRVLSRNQYTKGEVLSK